MTVKQKLIAHCIYCLIMSATMTACVSLTVTAVNLGFGSHFVEEWLYSKSKALNVGFALLLALSPLYKRVVNVIMHKIDSNL